jgi:hypothetical protein
MLTRWRPGEKSRDSFPFWSGSALLVIHVGRLWNYTKITAEDDDSLWNPVFFAVCGRDGRGELGYVACQTLTLRQPYWHFRFPSSTQTDYSRMYMPY